MCQNGENDENVWVVHLDGTRNWLASHSAACYAKVLPPSPIPSLPSPAMSFVLLK